MFDAYVINEVVRPRSPPTPPAPDVTVLGHGTQHMTSGNPDPLPVATGTTFPEGSWLVVYTAGNNVPPLGVKIQGTNRAMTEKTGGGLSIPAAGSAGGDFACYVIQLNATEAGGNLGFDVNNQFGAFAISGQGAVSWFVVDGGITAINMIDTVSSNAASGATLAFDAYVPAAGSLGAIICLGSTWDSSSSPTAPDFTVIRGMEASSQDKRPAGSLISVGYNGDAAVVTLAAIDKAGIILELIG